MQSALRLRLPSLWLLRERTPLTLILSWYEQKAVCILLTLLSLNIKGIYLGPTLPAFLSESVVRLLVDTYDLRPITAPEQDLDDILGRR